MFSIKSYMSMRSGLNSRRPSRVSVRMAAISRSILPIDDLMKLKDSSNSCASALSSSASAASAGGGIGAGRHGLRRRQSFDPLEDAGAQLLELAGKAHDVDQRRTQVVADDVGEALDLLVRLLQVGGALVDGGLEIGVHVAQLPFGVVALALRAPHEQDRDEGQRQHRARACGRGNRRQHLRAIGFRGADLEQPLFLDAHRVDDLADARGGPPGRIFLHDLPRFRLLAAACERHHRIEFLQPLLDQRQHFVQVIDLNRVVRGERASDARMPGGSRPRPRLKSVRNSGWEVSR